MDSIFKWSKVFKNPEEYSIKDLIKRKDLSVSHLKKLIELYSITDDDMLWEYICDNTYIISSKFIQEFKYKKLNWKRIILMKKFFTKEIFLEHEDILIKYLYLITRKRWFDIEMIEKYMHNNYLDWNYIFKHGKVDVEYLTDNIDVVKDMMKRYCQGCRIGFNFRTLSCLKNITIPFILLFGDENLRKWDWGYIMRTSYNVNTKKYYHIINKNKNINPEEFEKLPKDFLIKMFFKHYTFFIKMGWH